MTAIVIESKRAAGAATIVDKRAREAVMDAYK
jgi:hypothetical protein